MEQLVKFITNEGMTLKTYYGGLLYHRQGGCAERKAIGA